MTPRELLKRIKRGERWSVDYKALYEQMCERCDELDAKLAQYERHAQKPVAYMNQNDVIHEAGYEWGPNNDLTPLYAGYPPAREVWCDCGDGIMPGSGAKCANCVTAETPIPREWVGLTDEEIQRCYDEAPATLDGWKTYARAVEAALKERNYG